MEKIRESVRILHHRKVTPGDRDRLHAEQFERDEPFPFGCEELVVRRVDERCGDAGMLTERILADRGRCLSQTLSELAPSFRRQPGIHRLDRRFARPDRSALSVPRGKREAISKDVGRVGRGGERAEPWADVNQECWTTSCSDQRSLS